MKASSGLFFFILLIWMGGSTWYYVCKIKNHCEDKAKTEITELNDKDVIPEQDFISEKSENEISETSELTKEQILDDVKAKIENGYTIYNFPKNSIKNENIEASFNEFTENLKIFLDENASSKIEVIGHTDDIGSENANKKFGLKRANFIKKILIRTGINADQIITTSKGMDEPVDSNETDEGRQKNRRVVIKLIQN